MNILLEITNHKRKEIENIKGKNLAYWESFPDFGRETISLKKLLDAQTSKGIIAEFKRKSPSKGIFDANAKPEIITKGYVDAGVSALSILTDYTYFGGGIPDLLSARKTNPFTPILRKDFIVDTSQIYEAKAIGADVVLLIAASLSPKEVHEFAVCAKKLGLETLLEVKEKSEVEPYLNEYIDIIGVNNRNLEDFTVDINRSVEISGILPQNMTRISESGISKPEAIIHLRKSGFTGFLIGEAFMQTKDPIGNCEKLIGMI